MSCGDVQPEPAKVAPLYPQQMNALLKAAGDMYGQSLLGNTAPAAPGIWTVNAVQNAQSYSSANLGIG